MSIGNGFLIQPSNIVLQDFNANLILLQLLFGLDLLHNSSRCFLLGLIVLAIEYQSLFVAALTYHALWSTAN